MTRETKLHKIIIDSNLSVDMLIPVELTAIELKGLMVKANKLFNLSQTGLGLVSKKRKSLEKWDENELEIIMKNYGKLEPKQIAKLLPTRTKKQISMKIYYLQSRGRLKNGRK